MKQYNKTQPSLLTSSISHSIPPLHLHMCTDVSDDVEKKSATCDSWSDDYSRDLWDRWNAALQLLIFQSIGHMLGCVKVLQRSLFWSTANLGCVSAVPRDARLWELPWPAAIHQQGHHSPAAGPEFPLLHRLVPWAKTVPEENHSKSVVK